MRIWEVTFGKTTAVKVSASTYQRAIEAAKTLCKEYLAELPKRDMEILKVELICESIN